MSKTNGKPFDVLSKRGKPKVGIYEDVPFDEYLEWPCVNNSLLQFAKRSMAHLRYAMTAPKEETKPMRLGSLVHAGRLEPLTIPQRYAVMPAFEDQVKKADGSVPKSPKSTAEYQRLKAEWEAEHADMQIVEQSHYDMLLSVVKALSDNEAANRWLNGPGPVEVSMVWDDPETRIRCKGRVDKLLAGAAVDLKTAADVTDFQRNLANYGYYRQAAFYLDALEVLGRRCNQFVLVAVEREQPCAVRSAPVSERAIAQGRREYREAMTALAAACHTKNWPAPEDPDEWDLPEWALVEEPLELIVGDELILL